MALFEDTQGPQESLLHKRNDPNDLRLGEAVRTQPEDYDSARVVLIGLPQDEGVARNGGRVGAASAPSAIRQALYKLVAIPGLSLFDLGDTVTAETLEATHERHRAHVEQVLRDGKTVIALGGGNDTSYPDCAALSAVVGGDLLAFNIDAHFDVRIAPQRNSGTPYRQLLEGGHIAPQNFHEIGYNPSANSKTYVDYLREKGVDATSIMQVHQRGIDSVLHAILNRSNASAIFWGVDMDVVNAGDAPGVSAPNALGLRAHDLIALAEIAGRDPRSRVFEITEVNPLIDIDGRTSRLAAAAIWHFMRWLGVGG